MTVDSNNTVVMTITNLVVIACIVVNGIAAVQTWSFTASGWSETCNESVQQGKSLLGWLFVITLLTQLVFVTRNSLGNLFALPINSDENEKLMVKEERRANVSVTRIILNTVVVVIYFTGIVCAAVVLGITSGLRNSTLIAPPVTCTLATDASTAALTRTLRTTIDEYVDLWQPPLSWAWIVLACFLVEVLLMYAHWISTTVLSTKRHVHPSVAINTWQYGKATDGQLVAPAGGNSTLSDKSDGVASRPNLFLSPHGTHGRLNFHAP